MKEYKVQCRIPTAIYERYKELAIKRGFILLGNTATIGALNEQLFTEAVQNWIKQEEEK